MSTEHELACRLVDAHLKATQLAQALSKADCELKNAQATRDALEKELNGRFGRNSARQVFVHGGTAVVVRPGDAVVDVELSAIGGVS